MIPVALIVKNLKFDRQAFQRIAELRAVNILSFEGAGGTINVLALEYLHPVLHSARVYSIVSFLS